MRFNFLSGLILLLLFLAACGCSQNSARQSGREKSAHNPQLQKPVNPLYGKIGNSGVVLVYFDKKGCPACAQMEPNIKKSVQDTGVRLIKLIPDRQTRVDFGLGHFPTYCIYIDGNEYRRWIGITSSEELTDSIRRGMKR